MLDHKYNIKLVVRTAKSVLRNIETKYITFGVIQPCSVERTIHSKRTAEKQCCDVPLFI